MNEYILAALGIGIFAWIVVSAYRKRKNAPDTTPGDGGNTGGEPRRPSKKP